MHLPRSIEHPLLVFTRVLASHYVLIGVSAGVGLLLISAGVHLALGGFASAAAAIGVIAAVPPDQPAPRRGKLRQLLPAMVVGLPLFFTVQWLDEEPLLLGLLIVPASFFAFLGAAWGKRGIPLSVSAMLTIIFSIAVPGRAEGIAPLVTTAYFALGMALYIVYATLSNIVLNGRYRVQMLADTLLAIAALMRTQAVQFTAAAATPSDRSAVANPIGRLIREQRRWPTSCRPRATSCSSRRARRAASASRRCSSRCWRCATICWPASSTWRRSSRIPDTRR